MDSTTDEQLVLLTDKLSPPEQHVADGAGAAETAHSAVLGAPPGREGSVLLRVSSGAGVDSSIASAADARETPSATVPAGPPAAEAAVAAPLLTASVATPAVAAIPAGDDSVSAAAAVAGLPAALSVQPAPIRLDDVVVCYDDSGVLTYGKVMLASGKLWLIKSLAGDILATAKHFKRPAAEMCAVTLAERAKDVSVHKDKIPAFVPSSGSSVPSAARSAPLLSMSSSSASVASGLGCADPVSSAPATPLAVKIVPLAPQSAPAALTPPIPAVSPAAAPAAALYKVGDDVVCRDNTGLPVYGRVIGVLGDITKELPPGTPQRYLIDELHGSNRHKRNSDQMLGVTVQQMSEPAASYDDTLPPFVSAPVIAPQDQRDLDPLTAPALTPALIRAAAAAAAGAERDLLGPLLQERPSAGGDVEEEMDEDQGKSIRHTIRRVARFFKKDPAGAAILRRRQQAGLFDLPVGLCAQQIRCCLRFGMSRVTPVVASIRSMCVTAVIHAFITLLNTAAAASHRSLDRSTDTNCRLHEGAGVINQLQKVGGPVTAADKHVVGAIAVGTAEAVVSQSEEQSRDTVLRMLDYLQHMSNHVIRSDQKCFRKDFPGSLTSSWKPPRFNKIMPLSVVFAHDEQAYTQRHADQQLSSWQKEMPLLPMYTCSVPADGDGLLHAGLLADATLVGRKTMGHQQSVAATAASASSAASVSSAPAAAAAASVSQPKGQVELSPLVSFAQQLLQAKRDAFTGNPLMESRTDLVEPMHSYRAQSVHHAAARNTASW